MKTLKFKLPMALVILDILIYLFLFHSGVVLPFVNPTVAEYNQMQTSFPRDAGQKMTWILFHIPTSAVVDKNFGDRFLWFSIFQTGVIFFVAGLLVDYKRKKMIPL
jgi:hypothetical protein